ncbi:MAG: sensor histidine kinase, partial [Massilia sp.]
MSSKRINITVAVSWVLFWALMVSVAVQDYIRNGGHAMWQPVLWETSSMLAASILLVVQRHFTLRYDYLLARPARWFALQAAWLQLYFLCFFHISLVIRLGLEF